MQPPSMISVGGENTTGKEGRRKGGREGGYVLLHLLHRPRQIALLQHVIIRQHPGML